MTTPEERRDLSWRDRQVTWHPYTQHGVEQDHLPVTGAHGSLLSLEDGREIIDAISSWWACLHGHGRLELIDAMANQGRQLDHVLFAGTTHEPAVRLAEELVEITPQGLDRVFFSDNGSTSVEVAMKMAYQSWVHRGETERTVFLALEGSYHGDTFGAMSLGEPDPFFRPFEPLLFESRRVKPERQSLEVALDELGARAAAFVVEPLVQGAAGMVMHSPDFLRDARTLCDQAGIPLIADEVMTGFGRTGTLFACEQASIQPDLLCLSKGLTGGVIPLAVTLATEEIYDSFLSTDRTRAFFHGHTFTANPIGCALALASLDLVRSEDTPRRLAAIGEFIEGELRDFARTSAHVRELRRTGGIVALDLSPPPGEEAGYFASVSPAIRSLSVEKGVLLRPLGNVLYAMLPSCASEAECSTVVRVMRECVEECVENRQRTS